MPNHGRGFVFFEKIHFVKKNLICKISNYCELALFCNGFCVMLLLTCTKRASIFAVLLSRKVMLWNFKTQNK